MIAESKGEPYGSPFFLSCEPGKMGRLLTF